MAEAQEAATEALRQIGPDIAHDLKTPIQCVAVCLERLGTSDLPEEARAELAAVQDETTKIIGTFQPLLQIAQLEGGQGRETFTSVNLAELLTDLAEVYTPAVEETGATLPCEISAPLRVNGNRHLLSRLLANLFENAIRHAPRGPITLRLSGRRLSVSDRGPGIPSHRRDEVLHRLVHLERSRSTAGSGLGLSMVKAIADLHNAPLTLSDADPGPGLHVTLIFPEAA